MSCLKFDMIPAMSDLERHIPVIVRRTPILLALRKRRVKKIGVIDGENNPFQPFLVAQGFFQKERISAPTTEPMRPASSHMAGLPMTATTQAPPWGAGLVQPKKAERAPATAEPMMQEGSTWPGSAAANGMAPSEMKERPMM